MNYFCIEWPLFVRDGHPPRASTSSQRRRTAARTFAVVRDVVLVHDDDADVTARCGDEGHAITDALDEESHRERRGWL